MIQYQYQDSSNSLNVRKRVFSSQYYSGTEVNIYFDGRFISECKLIVFELTENVMPVYGYASYTPDGWGRGNRIIHGNFVVNMAGTNYLGEFVNDYVERYNSEKSYEYTKIGQTLQSKKNIADNNKVLMWESFKKEVQNSITEYELASIPFFKENSFDILITYKILDITKLDKSIGNFIQSVNDVHLTSVHTQLDITGKPIEQVYQFLAGDYNRTKRFIQHK